MNKNFRLAMAQINSLLGDMNGNADKIIKYAILARDQLQADVVVFPELALTGYPPEDLLLRNDFYDCVNRILHKVQNTIEGIYVILGYPRQTYGQRYNEAAVIYNKEIVATYQKQLLPNYGVFDEKRYFQPGTKSCVVDIKGIRVGIAICEDLWFREPIMLTAKAGAQLIVSINASPFDRNKPLDRGQIISSRAKENNLPIIYVNCVGGQDELVFDGGSMVLNAKGEITQRVSFFQETLALVDLNIQSVLDKAEPVVNNVLAIPSQEELAYQALVLGVRDYIEKNHFKRAIVGSSGGVDSALTLAIAVDAIGKDRVTAVFMPSRYTRDMSIEDSKTIAQNLGIKHEIISIEPIFQALLDSLAPDFKGLPIDITEENLQARCRGVILMALSNKTGAIVLSTGNKSEMAVGYATLYGDMAGGFCVLKDVLKTFVYRLVEYRNKILPVIPPRIITRPPSAELAPNQLDQDSLPPYPTLDAILERYVENDQSIQQIVADGFDRATVKKVLNLIDRNEYKRRQAPPGIKITARAFGRDRRYPITSAYPLLE
jgi:NAD+ synthase (glutamine-hydrolysing)